MKTYVVMLSEKFPKGHKKAGITTGFAKLLDIGINTPAYALHLRKRKIHTIRANYPLWEQRISEIQAGRAVLSVRQWEGKPYRSKQVEIRILTAKDGVGIQMLKMIDLFRPAIINGNKVELPVLAANDGLSFNDWYEWFKAYDLNKPLAIIHFSEFRY